MTSYRSQAVASVVLGTPLTFGLCGLYVTVGPATPEVNYVTGILLLLPTWIAVLLWALTRRSARRAWLGLGGTCIAIAVAIFVLRYFGGA